MDSRVHAQYAPWRVHGLSSACKLCVRARACDVSCRFNDLSSIDKLSSVTSKVDNLKGIMQSNIQQALKNTDKLEDIDDKVVVLADTANKFKSNASAVKRNMQCRYIKMVLLMTLLVAVVLTIIIVPIVINSNK